MMTMMETQHHFVSAIIILLSAGVPIYLTIKLKNNNLKKLTLILGIFILIHAVYHIVGFFGFNLLADGFLEPLSASVLIFFGIVYSGMGKPFRNNNLNMKNTMIGIGVLAVATTAIVVVVAATFAVNNWSAAGGSGSGDDVGAGAGVRSGNSLLLVMNSVTVGFLSGALGIFVWLAAKCKNIGSFQFQISIFIIIWILGDIISILENNRIIVFSLALQGNVGSIIHVVSMGFFSMVLWLRYYYSERRGKKMVEENIDVSRS
jgi:hypothetical protein